MTPDDKNQRRRLAAPKSPTIIEVPFRTAIGKTLPVIEEHLVEGFWRRVDDLDEERDVSRRRR